MRSRPSRGASHAAPSNGCGSLVALREPILNDMSFLLIPLHLTLLVAGAIATIVGCVLAWPHRRQPGGICLLLLLAGIAEWQVMSALGVSADTVADKRAWSQVGYIGIASVPTLWFAFVLRYLGDPRGTSRRFLAGLAIMPLVTLAIAATSTHHTLLWTRIELIETLDGARAVFHH